MFIAAVFNMWHMFHAQHIMALKWHMTILQEKHNFFNFNILHIFFYFIWQKCNHNIITVILPNTFFSNLI